jgi:hypothetical protein
MFWILWLPLGVFVLSIIIGLIKSIIKKDMGYLIPGFGYGIFIGVLISFFCGVLIGLNKEILPTQSVPDTEHPVYLHSLADDESISGSFGGFFIFASGSFSSDPIYDYRYYLPGTDRIATGSISQSVALLVEDAEVNPYYLEIKPECDLEHHNNFWTFAECDKIPYTVEFHIPKGSVIQQINIAP